MTEQAADTTAPSHASQPPRALLAGAAVLALGGGAVLVLSGTSDWFGVGRAVFVLLALVVVLLLAVWRHRHGGDVSVRRRRLALAAIGVAVVSVAATFLLPPRAWTAPALLVAQIVTLLWFASRHESEYDWRPKPRAPHA